MAGRHINRRADRSFRANLTQSGLRPPHEAAVPGGDMEPATGKRVADGARRVLRVGPVRERCRNFGAIPMFGILSARIAGVVGVLSLALIAAGLVSVPSFPMPAVPLALAEPAIFVNRAHKGDRLPVPRLAVREFEFAPLSPQSRPPAPAQLQIPPGCDGAFSPISSPLLANVFRRCIA
jgi:hypothetical protein